MSKVRIDPSVHDQLRDFLDESEKWSKQSDFVSQAVREKLDSEKDEVPINEELVKEIVRDELDESA